jgi:hypothetical protein
MSFTLVDVSTSTGPIQIKPYFSQMVENMGLEKYGLSLFDGVYHEEQLACIENNGVRRYVTGLNEFAPSIKQIKDLEKREAKINQIRQTVAQLEMELASNVIKPDDPDFWNKVKLLRPDNYDFWGKVSIRCGNDPVYLNPQNPYDLIKIYAIEEGGFSIIAKSYEDAKNKPGSCKFYLDRYEETINTKTTVKKLKNKALAQLTNLYDKNTNKLFYVAKILDASGANYKKSTPNDLLYDNMDVYINGNGVEASITRASESFIEVVDMSMEDLKIKAVVKDAIYYKMIVTKADGYIYEKQTNTMLGRNGSDVAEFLKNPINDDITTRLLEAVESYWNK